MCVCSVERKAGNHQWRQLRVPVNQHRGYCCFQASHGSPWHHASFRLQCGKGGLRSYNTVTVLCLSAVWREMVAMQRRGTNVVVGADRAKLGAKELDVPSVLSRNRRQITAILVSLTVFVVLLSKCTCLQGSNHNFPVVPAEPVMPAVPAMSNTIPESMLCC